MTTFEEIASREDLNTREIVLYPEGLFYKAYEKSAFLFTSRISAFRPTKKRIKYLGREIVSIGFPAKTLTKYFPAPPAPNATGETVVVLDEPIDEAAFEAWKEAVPLKEPKPRPAPEPPSGEATRNLGNTPAVAGIHTASAACVPGQDSPAGENLAEEIARRVRDFRLESATPVQCVIFIAELKQRINGDL